MAKFPLGAFQGLDDLGIANNARLTRFLLNVEVRNGRLAGRFGMDELNNITGVSATTPIIGLFPYYDKALTTQLLRITPTKAFELTNSGDSTWVDVTGTNLLAASTDFPQAINHDELLLFVTGKDRARKWAGSGNNTVVLGGTPPFAKAIMQMVGFVMLGNVSDDGTFTDVTLGHLKVRFTDDYDNDWSPCIGHELILDETNGQIEAGLVNGIYGVWAKSDAIITTRFLGSGRGFFQSALKFGGSNKGVIAPLSFKQTKAGIIFLGTDLELYITDGQTVKPLPPRVQKKLQSKMQVSKARNTFAEVVEGTEEYNLFIPIDSDTWSSARVRYNFRTGDFSYNEYDGHEFVRAASYQWSNVVKQILVASTTNLVWELDTTDKDDNGTVVDRFWRSDWQNFGNQDPKKFKGAYLVFDKVLNCRVKVGVAIDRNNKVLFEKTFDLKGTAPAAGRDAEEDAVVDYIPIKGGIEGNEFDLRVKMYHYGTNRVTMLSGFIDWERASGEVELRETGGADKG